MILCETSDAHLACYSICSKPFGSSFIVIQLQDYDPYEENPGTAPFSEPETQIMRKLAVSFDPHIWVNVHSGMEVTNFVASCFLFILFSFRILICLILVIVFRPCSCHTTIKTLLLTELLLNE